MKLHLLSGAGLIALGAFALPATAQDSEPALQDVIIVTGSRPVTATESAIAPDAGPLTGGDVTYLTARTPGGARIANGELSGQMQYRGLFGERLNLRVDGQRLASGGPNLMDPAFHYAPAPLVAAVVIDRGVSPVSEGPGLAGGADAVFKKVDFADSAAAEFGYDLSFGARSVNDSFSGGGVIGASTDSWRFNVIGSWEEGDDTEYKDGTIAGTAFERGVFGLSAGAKVAGGTLSLDARRQNTGPSGNPPFPMDIRYFDTDFARLAYDTEIGGARVSAEVHYTDVEHAMNNFDQRPAPPMMNLREAFASATTRGAGLKAGFDALGGGLLIGLDGDKVDHNMFIVNPANAGFFVTPFPHVTEDRFGAFAEWTGALGPFDSELGLRLDRNSYDAGDAVLGPALPAMPQMLAMQFNTADRSGEEMLADVVARFWTPSENGLSWRVTLARKQQMPGYIQRYGWLPLNASGGLADGNIYVGDLTLDPETAWIAEAGFDFATSDMYARPTVFVRQVDDYIQGVPFDDTPGVLNTPQEMVANMNGDPTPLRWANVDARLYGFDMDFGYDFTGPLRIDGVLNYVRGERRDIDDNLYRVAAHSLTADLTWEAAVWSATFEARAVAEQNEVSATNSEAPSPGYVVLSLYGDWQVKDGVRLSAGVENLLDQVTRDHLAGYNRNGFGDVALGSRVPGAGRGAFIRLSVTG
ncbi:MAG: TonB-dependent receptor [Hyphomonas sp.]|nr:TonB-dependent receptor [Hyphomonas sp.]